MRKVLEGWRQDGCDLIVHSIPDVSCYEPTESGGRSPSASVIQTLRRWFSRSGEDSGP
jgi:hypothetical protein